MRAVHLVAPVKELEQRRRLGLDKLDEMWEGELHMVPPPDVVHQDIASEILTFLRLECRRRQLGRAFMETGLYHPASPDVSWRVPDLIFVSTANAHLITDRRIQGAVDVVVEVRSPDDETYEKFAFYAELRVREILVVDRDTRRPEIYRLAGAQFLAVAADAAGWVSSDALNVRFRFLQDPVRLRAEPLDAEHLGMEV